MTNKVKTKRKLSNIDFSREDAHIALTSKTINGGPANGVDYALVMKAANQTESIEKMQQVQVTLELPEFLRRFFNMYYEDAEVLAQLLGYVEEEDDSKSEDSYDAYIKERVNSFTILKSLKESEDIAKSFEELDEDSKKAVLETQSKLESVLKQKEDTGISGNVKSPKRRVSKKKEISMSEKDTQVEMVEKSQLVSIEKALSETQELLKAAQDAIAKFEAEKKEAVRKSRFDAVKTAVGSDEVATVLFKAVGLVEDQVEFEEIVKALGDMKALVEKSDLFQEVGASAEDQAPAIEESGVTKLLKAQFATK